MQSRWNKFLHPTARRDRNMVLSAEKRKALATKLNNMVNLPFLSEAQEQTMAESIINAILSPVEKAMPSDAEMQQMARSSGEDTMQKTVKANVVAKVNKQIDIPMVNEAQEAMLFGMIVDYVLKDKFDEVHRSLGATTATTSGTTTTTNAASDTENC
jgi:hypothetical protein